MTLLKPIIFVLNRSIAFIVRKSFPILPKGKTLFDSLARGGVIYNSVRKFRASFVLLMVQAPPLETKPTVDVSEDDEEDWALLLDEDSRSKSRTSNHFYVAERDKLRRRNLSVQRVRRTPK